MLVSFAHQVVGVAKRGDLRQRCTHGQAFDAPVSTIIPTMTSILPVVAVGRSSTGRATCATSRTAPVVPARRLPRQAKHKTRWQQQMKNNHENPSDNKTMRTKIKKKVEANETAMAKFQEAIDIVDEGINALKAILRVGRDETKRNELLSNSDVASVINIVESVPTLGKQNVELAKQKSKPDIARRRPRARSMVSPWRQTKNSSCKSTRFQLLPSCRDNHKSGIVYIEDTRRIAISGLNRSDIGLLTKNGQTFLLKDTTNILNLSQAS